MSVNFSGYANTTLQTIEVREADFDLVRMFIRICLTILGSKSRAITNKVSSRAICTDWSKHGTTGPAIPRCIPQIASLTYWQTVVVPI